MNQLGQVVGVNSAVWTQELSQNINFAVPVIDVLPLLKVARNRTSPLPLDAPVKGTLTVRDLAKELRSSFGEISPGTMADVGWDEDGRTALFFISFDTNTFLGVMARLSEDQTFRQQTEAVLYYEASKINAALGVPVTGAFMYSDVFEVYPSDMVRKGYQVTRRDDGRWTATAVIVGIYFVEPKDYQINWLLNPSSQSARCRALRAEVDRLRQDDLNQLDASTAARGGSYQGSPHTKKLKQINEYWDGVIASYGC